MRLPGKGTSLYVLGFVAFLLAFAYLELTYTRRVDGISMLPTLEEGDLVVVQNSPFGDLTLGDVIVYDPPCSVTGASVIHRVVGFSGGGVVTKGDNNNYADPGPISDGPITEDCFVGKVVFVIPYIERIASLPYGTNYILALLIFLAVVYLELRDRGRREKDDGAQSGQADTSVLVWRLEHSGVPSHNLSRGLPVPAPGHGGL